MHQTSRHILSSIQVSYLTYQRDMGGVTSEEIEMIWGACIQNTDNFTFLFLLNLCLTIGIAPRKIVALYCWADEMIVGVHKEQKETIVELKALWNVLK